jgi:phage gp36-like protein
MSQYAQPSDLANYGLSAAALASFTTDEQNAALEAASDEADGYLCNQFTLPLLAWKTDLTIKVCKIAAETLICSRGFNPEGSDETYIMQAEAARRWLRDVSSKKTTPQVTDSSPSSAPGVTTATGPKVFSQPTRGFSRVPPRPGGGYPPGRGGGGIW